MEKQVATDSASELNELVHDIPAIVYRLAFGHPSLGASISADVQRTLGYNPTELDDLEQWWFDNIHPVDRELALKKFQVWYENGADGVLRREYRFRHQNGGYLWVEDSLRQQHAVSQSVQFYVGILVVIDAEVKARSRIQHLTEVAPGAFFQLQIVSPTHFYFPYVSHQVNELLELSPTQLQEDGCILLEKMHADDAERLLQSFADASTSAQTIVCEFPVEVGGQIKWLSMHAAAEQHLTEVSSWFGMLTDATQRKTIEKEMQQAYDDLRLAQEVGRVGHWKLNIKTNELMWSDMIYQILGFDPNKVSPNLKLFNDLVHPDDLDTVLHHEKTAIEEGLQGYQHRIRHADGHYIWVEEYATPQADGVTLIGAVRDISEQKALELKLRKLVATDDMTGLFNRRFFSDQVERALADTKRHGTPLSLTMVDIDYFKRVNDTYGHPTGDEVIIEMAQLLKRGTRISDCCARIGGEEFAILLPETTLSQAEQIAEQLRANIEQTPIAVQGGQSLSITVTAGIATAEAGDSWTQLLGRADKALYRGKQSGRNRVHR